MPRRCVDNRHRNRMDSIPNDLIQHPLSVTIIHSAGLMGLDYLPAVPSNMSNRNIKICEAKNN